MTSHLFPSGFVARLGTGYGHVACAGPASLEKTSVSFSDHFDETSRQPLSTVPGKLLLVK